jgi:hypothetical protein
MENIAIFTIDGDEVPILTHTMKQKTTTHDGGNPGHGLGK